LGKTIDKDSARIAQGRLRMANPSCDERKLQESRAESDDSLFNPSCNPDRRGSTVNRGAKK
jgi:hypothetical protein